MTEALGFATLVALFWTLDTLAKRSTRNIDGFGLDDFRLIAEQATSATAVYVLIPAVAWWLTRFPLTSERIATRIAGHVIGSVLFSAAHYFLMIGMRFAVYPLFDRHYVLSDYWAQNLLIEYQKDIKIYAAIVVIITLWRHYRDRGRDAIDFSDRMVVQTGKGERIILQSDIEYLEASRNYVAVHTADRELLVRQTLSSLEEQLGSAGFARTHRSFVVNLAEVTELQAEESGRWKILMRSGKEVPLSRGYRDAVRARLGMNKAP